MTQKVKMVKNTYLPGIRVRLVSMDDKWWEHATHKTMMGLLVRKAKNLPEEKKNAEVRAMIETYNQGVDFIDYESLSSIIDELK